MGADLFMQGGPMGKRKSLVKIFFDSIGTFFTEPFYWAIVFSYLFIVGNLVYFITGFTVAIALVLFVIVYLIQFFASVLVCKYQLVLDSGPESKIRLKMILKEIASRLFVLFGFIVVKLGLFFIIFAPAGLFIQGLSLLPAGVLSYLLSFICFVYVLLGLYFYQRKISLSLPIILDRKSDVFDALNISQRLTAKLTGLMIFLMGINIYYASRDYVNKSSNLWGAAFVINTFFSIVFLIIMNIFITKIYKNVINKEI